MSKALFQAAIRRFVLFSALLLVLAMAGLTGVGVSGFGERLLPEIRLKVETVGNEIVRRMQRGLEFHDDVATLRGVPDLFERVLEQNPEVAYLTLADADGRTVVRRGEIEEGPSLGRPGHVDLALPITSSGRVVGTLHLGIDVRFAQQVLREMAYDVVTVLAVSLLITFGLLSFFIQVRIAGQFDAIRSMIERVARGDLRPWRGGGRAYDRLSEIAEGLNAMVVRVHRYYQEALSLAGASGPVRAALMAVGARKRLGEPPVDDTPPALRLITMRVVVFLYFLAEELMRPFLPLFIKDMAAEAGPLSTGLAISLPLSAFIFVIAVVQPFGGAWSERLGRRRTFIAAALLSSGGLALSAFVESYWQLLVLRIVQAIGYGVAFIACQGYAVDNSTAATRTRGMAYFVGGVMAAAVCGPSLGGILADHLGVRPALLVAAGVALAAAAVGLALMQETQVAERPQAHVLSLRQLLRVLSNRRLLALLIFCAVPAKIVLSGVLFYLTPLYLAALNESPSVTGRVMMIYGLAMVFVGHVAATAADQRPALRPWFTSVGGLVSSLGLLALPWMPGELWVVVVAVTALGIGQAFSVSPQLALVPEICAAECRQLGSATVLGVFRLVERAGGALGPLVAASLAGIIGQPGAAAAIGFGVAAGAVLFIAVVVLSSGGSAAAREVP